MKSRCMAGSAITGWQSHNRKCNNGVAKLQFDWIHSGADLWSISGSFSLYPGPLFVSIEIVNSAHFFFLRI